MNNIVQLPNTDDILEQASDWVARLDTGSLSEADKEALNLWLNENQAHCKALIEMAEFMDSMSVLSQLSEMIPLDMLAVSARKTSPVTSMRLPFTPTKVVLVSVLLLLLTLGIWQSEQAEPKKTLVAQTNIGEYKTITLVDGSRTTLNTYSQINVDFTEQERKVTLARGEAHFEVKANKERPFIVYAGNSVIKAIGTAFNVETRGGSVEVTVTEGLVEISSIEGTDKTITLSSSNKKLNQQAQAEVMSVSAGQLMIAEGGVETLQTIDLVTMEKKLAWQKGMVVFEGQTLEQVVEEISRYTTTTFIITDEETRAIRVGGYFETGDIDKMLDILRHGFNIDAKKNNSGTIYLSRLDTDGNSQK